MFHVMKLIFLLIKTSNPLKASPRIRFNKDGTLLAVSTNDNGIKILANSDGLRLLWTYENLSYDSSRASESLTKVARRVFFHVACELL